ncbi:MAG: hypothetical protein FWF59_14300 [Turicibacter sp.]|nr:hypothetical protein [Turicibacter sp.]
MKKNNKRMIIFILTLATNLFLLFFLNYQLIGRNQMLIANGLYSNWSIELTDSEGNIDEMAKRDRRVFIEHTLNGNVRTFLGSTNWVPPMTEGDFFTDSDQRPVAVVGERMLPESGNYFIFEDQEFEIIGMLGAGFPSLLDNLVLLSPPMESLPVERVIIDTDTRQSMGQISEGLAHRDVFSAWEQNRFQTQLRFGRDLFEEMMIVNTVLITLLFVAISSHTFRVMTEENDEILYLQGFTPKEIMMKNHGNLVLAFGLSFVVAFLLDIISRNFVVLPNLSWFLGVFLFQQAFFGVMVAIKIVKGGLRRVF